MSREQENPFRLTSTDILDALRSDSFSSNVSRAAAASYHRIPQRNFDVLHNSPRNEDIPIFIGDTRQPDSFSRGNFNDEHGANNLSISSGIRNISNSSALEALQSYGPGIQSPSHLHQWREWNKDYDQISTGMSNSSEMLLNQMHESESSMTPGSAACNPFTDLNLNTVDEEDEFLYGDSNSLPEAPISKTEDYIIRNEARLDTGWSDDEDVYAESAGATYSKLDPGHRKTPSVWDVRNKKVEALKLSQSRQEEQISNLVREKASLSNISKQQYQSPAEPDVIIISPKSSDEQNLKLVDSDKSSQSTSGTKSMYHLAAEMLKKQTIEKSKLMSQCSENVDASLKNASVESKLDSQDTKSFEKEESDLRNDKSVKYQRQLPKAFAQKHLDKIKDYIKGTSRKRDTSLEEYGPDSKCLRLEAPKKLSPSRHHSPHDSPRRRSPLRDYRHRSPNRSKYKSPDRGRMRGSSPSYHSKRRSPDFERGRHPSYEEHRHSRSPGRRSRSPGYRRYKARSPRLRRSRERSRSPGVYRFRRRSRSPGYYSSKHKSYGNYRKSHTESSITPERYRSKKKRKTREGSSESSFSLSVSSKSGSSSDSSDESSDEKEKNTSKQPKKTVPKSDKKKESDAKADVIIVGENPAKKSDTSVLSDVITKSLSDIFNRQNKTTKDTDLNCETFSSLNKDEDKLNNIYTMLQNNQLITQLVEGIQEQSSTYTPSSMTENINIASNPQRPIMSCPQTYSYSTMPTVPASYLQPQVNTFSPIVPLQGFPLPVMPPAPTTMYDPYSESVNSIDSNCTTVKKKSVRPSTLRTIPVSDSLSTTNTSDTDAKTMKSSPHNSAKSSSHESMKLSSKELEKSSLESSKQFLDNKTKESRESERIVSAASKPDAENKPKENVADENETVDKYKKFKAEKYLIQSRMNSAVTDLVEMRQLLDNTFGKVASQSDKILYSKCKSILKSTSDSVSNYIKESKRIEDTFSKFKSKLSQDLLSELLKIKVEQCEEVSCNDRYIGYDPGDHICFDCNVQFKSIANMVEHIQSSEHKEHINNYDNSWKNFFNKEPIKEDENKKCVRQPVKGVEFLKPITGFFCTLCKDTILDSSIAEEHVKCHDHLLNFKNFIKKNPLYEKKFLFKRYVQISVLAKKKKKQELEEKKQLFVQSKKDEEATERLLVERKKKEEAAERLLVERKKKEEAAEERIKEIIRNEKSKEKIVEELADDDSGDISASNSQKLANIKLNLTNKKDTGKPSEKSKLCKEPETKTVQKFIYIGKAPNFKKPQVEKTKPWYKRETILSKKDESELDIPSPVITSKATKAVEKDSIHKMKTSNKVDTYHSDSEPKQRQNAPVKLTHLCEKVTESKNGDNIDVKTSKSSLVHSERWSTKSPTTVSGSSVGRKNSVPKSKDLVVNPKSKDPVVDPKNKDPVVNQAIKNILLGTDAAHQHISLSEIKLPQTSPKKSFKDSVECVPMDIDNSQDHESKRKLRSEEDKDFYILGINKDDLKPLVIPVPPPSSMITYPSSSSATPSSMITYPSSSSTQSYLSSSNITYTAPVDFSVPPPSLPPLLYQNNTPTMHLYGNINNTQSMGPYSYPSNNPSMSMYPTQSNMQPISPFSSPPPLSPYKNQTSMTSYPNPGNVPCMPQFSNTSNMSSVPPFSNAKNSLPPSPSRHISKPPLTSFPNNKPSLLPSSNNTQAFVPPPNTTCISSFTQSNSNTNAGYSNVIKIPISPQQSKSPTLTTKDRNLITIVPTNDPVQKQISSVESANKSVNLKALTSASSSVSDITDNIVIGKKLIAVGKNKNTESNAVTKQEKNLDVRETTVKRDIPENTVTVVVTKENSKDSLNSGKNVLEQTIENNAKSVIDQCTEKIGEELKVGDTEEIKNSDVGASSTSLDDSKNKNDNLIKINNNEKFASDEISTVKFKLQNNESKAKTTDLKSFEMQIDVQNIETEGNATTEMSSVKHNTLADNLNEIIGDVACEASDISSRTQTNIEKSPEISTLEKCQGVVFQNQSTCNLVNVEKLSTVKIKESSSVDCLSKLDLDTKANDTLPRQGCEIIDASSVESTKEIMSSIEGVQKSIVSEEDTFCESKEIGKSFSMAALDDPIDVIEPIKINNTDVFPDIVPPSLKAEDQTNTGKSFPVYKTSSGKVEDQTIENNTDPVKVNNTEAFLVNETSNIKVDDQSNETNIGLSSCIKQITIQNGKVDDNTVTKNVSTDHCSSVDNSNETNEGKRVFETSTISSDDGQDQTNFEQMDIENNLKESNQDDTSAKSVDKQDSPKCEAMDFINQSTSDLMNVEKLSTIKIKESSSIDCLPELDIDTRANDKLKRQDCVSMDSRSAESTEEIVSNNEDVQIENIENGIKFAVDPFEENVVSEKHEFCDSKEIGKSFPTAATLMADPKNSIEAIKINNYEVFPNNVPSSLKVEDQTNTGKSFTVAATLLDDSMKANDSNNTEVFPVNETSSVKVEDQNNETNVGLSSCVKQITIQNVKVDDNAVTENVSTDHCSSVDNSNETNEGKKVFETSTISSDDGPEVNNLKESNQDDTSTKSVDKQVESCDSEDSTLPQNNVDAISSMEETQKIMPMPTLELESEDKETFPKETVTAESNLPTFKESQKIMAMPTLKLESRDYETSKESVTEGSKLSAFSKADIIVNDLSGVHNLTTADHEKSDENVNKTPILPEPGESKDDSDTDEYENDEP